MSDCFTPQTLVTSIHPTSYTPIPPPKTPPTTCDAPIPVKISSPSSLSRHITQLQLLAPVEDEGTLVDTHPVVSPVVWFSLQMSVFYLSNLNHRAISLRVVIYWWKRGGRIGGRMGAIKFLDSAGRFLWEGSYAISRFESFSGSVRDRWGCGTCTCLCVVVMQCWSRLVYPLLGMRIRCSLTLNHLADVWYVRPIMRLRW